MLFQCPVWEEGDFSECFHQNYLQNFIPMTLCGVSFFFVVGQLIDLWVNSDSDHGDGYTALSQNENVPGAPTQHYHDDQDEETGVDVEPSPNPDVYVEVSQPRLQRLRLGIEFITTLGILALNILLYLITPSIGPLVVWCYVLSLVISRATTLQLFSKIQLWYHTTLLYFFLLVIGILDLRSNILHPPEDSNVQRLTIAAFVLIVFLNIIAFTTRVGNRTVVLEYSDNLVSSREPLASLFSYLTFSWANAIVWKGYKKTCEIEDVWNLAPEDKAARVLSSYRKVKKERKLWLHFLAYLRTRLFIQALWGSVTSIFVFFPTILLKAIIEYVEQPDATPASTAWFCVVLLLLSSCFQSIGDSQALWGGQRMSLNLGAVAIGEIYAKALRRKAAAGAKLESDDEKDKAKGAGNSSLADEESSTKGNAKTDTAKPADPQANSGKIINLMSNDSSRICEIPSYIQWLWGSIPVQLVLSIVLLYRTLGWCAFAGIVPTLFAFPIGLIISKRFFSIGRRIMAATDMRLETTNEVLVNIRIIKYFAWEHRFKSRIEDTRKKELTQLRNMYFLYLLNTLIFSSFPFLVNLSAFLSYTLLEGKPLLPSIAFTSISLFQLLQMPLHMLSAIIMYVANYKTCSDRVENFLAEEETEKYIQLRGDNVDATGQRVVGFDNATFIWGGKNEVAEDGSQAFKMIDLDVRFHLDQLNIIAGKTGSGKTSMLMALLGEMTKMSGKVYLPGGYDRQKLIPDPVTGLTESVAYCAQQAWLLNGTVKENILFSSPLDNKRYQAVLKACALKPDIKIWADGDETLVGEKGITLSGGQKQRISLARALYSDARYILLDDCLSAVDSHTGKWIFDKCIRGPLMAKRTCILVTHNIALCIPKADFVVVLDNGIIAFKGLPQDAMDSGHLGDDVLSNPTPETENGSELHEDEVEETAPIPDDKKNVDPRLEKKAEGRVGKKVMLLYLSAMGKWYFWAFWFVFYILDNIAKVLPNIWVREWSNEYLGPRISVAMLLTNFRPSLSTDYLRPLLASFWTMTTRPAIPFAESAPLSTSTSEPINVRYYISVYALIGIGSCIIGTMSSAIVFAGSLNAAYSIHSRVLEAVTRAKFKFFDSTPLGQIVNRFSRDIETIDQEVAMVAVNLISFLGTLATMLILITAITPQFLLPGAVLALMYFFIAKFYLAASTDLKRMESVAKSPIYQQFGETLAGIVTIRAYGDEERFILDNHNRINTANRPSFSLWSLNRWLSIRLDFTGAFTSFFAAAFIVWNADSIDAGAAGLSLGYALQFTRNVLTSVRYYGMNEQNMNSVERIKEYLELEPEAPAEIEATRPPANWPVEGSVEFVDYTTGYRPDLPPVLKKVSFTIKGKEKVGIVGRTGAGKSSLALALFRALEAQEGKILIDGIDISTIGLNDLRHSLTMVPQDPTLFTGTIRSNLDPFNLYADEDIFAALRTVHLLDNSGSASASGTATPAIQESGSDASSTTLLSASIDSTKINKNIFSNLAYPITESGSNLSGGQKQLLCLVRALLAHPKILVMDEATASIDYATDKKIQETIRGLGDTTIVTIAHRLKTIVDYDAVVVMERGEVMEWGAPWELLREDGGVGKGVFMAMCVESGDWEVLKAKAEEAWKVKNGVLVET